MGAPWRTTFGLVATVSLAFALTTPVIGFVAYLIAHEALELQLDHRIAAETQALLAERGVGGTEELATVIHRRDAARSTASLGYILVDGDGRRLAGELDAEAPEEPGYVEFLRYRGGSGVAQAIITSLPDGGRLVVAADRSVIDEIDDTLLRLFAAAFAATLLLAVGGAWTVGAATRARLRRIDQAAQAIIAGDLGQRVEVDGSGNEFDQVAATLNEMLDRMGSLLENLRQVSNDVAHDLRTPLTRLEHRLDEALRETSDAGRQAAIVAARSQVHELLELFAALLRISEVEAGGLRAGFRPVSLSAMLTDLVETYQPDAEASGHRLESGIASGIVVEGDRRLLRQMVANLLDNALRHTPAGTTVRVGLSGDGKDVLLSVADDGPGVPEAESGRLFERFRRTESSRSTYGHGLGLALVAAVARMHHGVASLAAGPGFTVHIRLADRRRPGK
ncbi:MAG: HAMP domain-containing histidine kinase [Chromatiales bacterium]|nr:HAMP domain-containing histidine kinase [Chromatiales bacterium]